MIKEETMFGNVVYTSECNYYKISWNESATFNVWFNNRVEGLERWVNVDCFTDNSIGEDVCKAQESAKEWCELNIL